MRKNIGMIIVVVLIITIIIFIIPNNKTQETKKENQIISNTIEEKKEDIILKDIDGNGKNYSFVYNNEIYIATYVKENWNIKDSYRIKDYEIMIQICEELLKIHPIHGKDMISYRTAEDMVYEWLQHNLAYEILPENNPWRKNAKDVDFDPKDQGKSLKELYESRTGQKFIF